MVMMSIFKMASNDSPSSCWLSFTFEWEFIDINGEGLNVKDDNLYHPVSEEIKNLLASFVKA